MISSSDVVVRRVKSRAGAHVTRKLPAETRGLAQAVGQLSSRMNDKKRGESLVGISTSNVQIVTRPLSLPAGRPLRQKAMRLFNNQC